MQCFNKKKQGQNKVTLATLAMLIALYFTSFALGFALATYTSNPNSQSNTGNNKLQLQLVQLQQKQQRAIQTAKSIFYKPEEKPSPKDRIKENQIKVLRDKVIINLDNPEWAVFTNTNSMDPTLDEESIAIEIKANCTDIQPGDIVSYYSNIAKTVVIHRVIEKGFDEKGVYFKFKGDNNAYTDPEKVRCEQLRRVVVGILY